MCKIIKFCAISYPFGCKFCNFVPTAVRQKLYIRLCCWLRFDYIQSAILLMTEIPRFYCPDSEFLEPYIRREVGANDITVPIMISSTDIYRVSPGDIATEDSPVDSNSVWAAREKAFSEAYPEGIIVRCAPITATGMRGRVFDLAKDIAKGIFFHFPGNEARMSVVHATDVARAVALINGTHAAHKVYNLTDNIDPSVHDLAEALAYRMNNKRISTLSTRPQQMLGKFVYGRRYAIYTTERRYNSARFIEEFKFTPVAVCDYLRTHVYDETSL